MSKDRIKFILHDHYTQKWVIDGNQHLNAFICFVCFLLFLVIILAIIFAFITGICVFIFTNAAKIAGLIALVVFLWIGYNSFMKYENPNPNKIQSSISTSVSNFTDNVKDDIDKTVDKVKDSIK